MHKLRKSINLRDQYMTAVLFHGMQAFLLLLNLQCIPLYVRGHWLLALIYRNIRHDGFHHNETAVVDWFLILTDLRNLYFNYLKDKFFIYLSQYYCWYLNINTAKVVQFFYQKLCKFFEAAVSHHATSKRTSIT